jgi:hemerythrin-like domain-containing protein
MSALLAQFQPRTLTEWMARDHAVLDQRLDDVSRMVDDGELERADHHFTDVSEHALAHMQVEESHIFPRFERLTGIDEDGPTALLRWEHNEMRQALDEMRTALARGHAADFHRAREAYERLDSQHRVSEHRLMFPLIDQVLGEDELSSLVAELDNRSNK